jgi:hypothetical protein
VDVDQALAFSARGMRRFLFSFDLCCELPQAVFDRLVEHERDLLGDSESWEGMEADLLVYGRRQAHDDTRVLAVVLARHVLDDD